MRGACVSRVGEDAPSLFLTAEEWSRSSSITEEERRGGGEEAPERRLRAGESHYYSRMHMSTISSCAPPPAPSDVSSATNGVGRSHEHQAFSSRRRAINNERST